MASLIEQKFGVRIGLTAVGELLARLGITPQKPLDIVELLKLALQDGSPPISRWHMNFTSNLPQGTPPSNVPAPPI